MEAYPHFTHQRCRLYKVPLLQSLPPSAFRTQLISTFHSVTKQTSEERIVKLKTRMVVRAFGCVTCRVDTGETTKRGKMKDTCQNCEKVAYNLKVMFQILTSRKELASRQVHLITKSDNPNDHDSLSAIQQSSCQTYIYLLF